MVRQAGQGFDIEGIHSRPTSFLTAVLGDDLRASMRTDDPSTAAMKGTESSRTSCKQADAGNNQ